MTLTLWCLTCQRRRLHDVSGSSATCKTCQTVRPVEGDLLPAEPHLRVVDMRFCRWCVATLPADHVCPAGSVGCMEREPAEDPCGACSHCLAAQMADLARYGSPNDLDTPWSAS